MARAPLYQLPGRPLAYFPAIVPHVGSVNAAIVLCQLIYWTPRAKDEEGWIYKTQLELMQETGLSRREQRSARTELKRRGLLEERYERLDHQLYFKINVEVYNALIAAICDNPLILNQVPKRHLGKDRNGTSGSTETELRDGPKRDFDNKVVSNIPKITTEMETVAHATNSKTCIGFEYAGKRFCDGCRATHWGSRH
jgi:hypothetical protein